MVIAGERTLFDEAIERISAALEAHRDEPGWREVVERTRGNRGSATYVVTIHGPAAGARESYLIRVCGGRFEIVSRVVREAAPDWRVSSDELRRLCERDAPRAEGFPLAWLARRLGIERDGDRG